MSAHFYVDESGDLGWKFDAPYRHGGSSRYLTIASLVCPPTKDHYPKRIVADLYKKFRWNPQKEKKWADMGKTPRNEFTVAAQKLITTHTDIKLFSITVFKERVSEHIRKDCNKLYNYMINLSLIDEMCQYGHVCLIPDPRSIKVQSKNSLHDYLDICLTFDKGVETILKTKPADSAQNRNLQFTDMLAGLVQNHYEDSISDCWNILKPHICAKHLFH
jgi:hypothetical protein